MKPLSYGSETSHNDIIYIADVQRRGFSLIDQQLSNKRGYELSLDEFEIFLDICTVQKDYAYIVMLNSPL